MDLAEFVVALSDTRHWLDPRLKEAGIENYLWHDNRHTACSRWVMTGVPLAAVAQYAGHKTVAMTMRYSHLIPDLNTQASEKMMSIYNEPVVDQGSKKWDSEKHEYKKPPEHDKNINRR